MRDLESPADVKASEAGTLFVERARAVTPAFALTAKNAAAIARVCRRLDGIPLAIELAAARLTALSVDELARRVDDRFRLLTGGARTALPRQRTLRALVDWSYELLSTQERRVLDTLAVFAGSFSLEAAESVCASDAADEMSVLDAIERLVTKSLLLVEQQLQTETRYRLLETIRQYAGEKLAESGRADEARQRHCAFFLGIALQASDAMNGAFALEWLDRFEADHDNLRAALDWSAEAAPSDYASLAGAMAIFWDTRGHFTEGCARLERALALHGARDKVRLDALLGAGLLAYRLDLTQRSDEILSEAIVLAQELGDTLGEIDATVSLAIDRTWHGADATEPLALRARALATEVGDAAREGVAVLTLGRAAVLRADYREAENLFLEGARLLEAAGCVLRLPLAIQYAGECAFEQLDFAAARRLLDQALILHRRMGNVHDAATTLRLLGSLDLNEKRLDEARARTEESLRMFRDLHDPNCAAFADAAQSAVLLAAGAAAEALSHAEAAAATFRRQNALRPLAGALRSASGAHVALGDGEAARRALADALDAQRRTDYDRWLPRLLESVVGLWPQSPAAPSLLGSAAALRERWALPVFPD
jgi:tetratricopeptide (TPR) repeat protein